MTKANQIAAIRTAVIKAVPEIKQEIAYTECCGGPDSIVAHFYMRGAPRRLLQQYWPGAVIPTSSIPNRQHSHRRFRVSNFIQTPARDRPRVTVPGAPYF